MQTLCYDNSEPPCGKSNPDGGSFGKHQSKTDKSFLVLFSKRTSFFVVDGGSLPNLIEPVDAAAMLRDGAVLVDIRGADEHARARIPGAYLAPFDRLAEAMPETTGRAVIFHCKTGMRTGANAARLGGVVDGPSYIMAGGLDAWRRAGLPVVEG
jgi:rhodanese-related sulfurtransferase